jgi:hypothetical protein
MDTNSEPIIKTDVLGRIKTPAARREQLIDEFERSGLSGCKFAELAGLKYKTSPPGCKSDGAETARIPNCPPNAVGALTRYVGWERLRPQSMSFILIRGWSNPSSITGTIDSKEVNPMFEVDTPTDTEILMAKSPRRCSQAVRK